MSLPPPPNLAEVCAKAERLPCAPNLLPKLVAVLQKEESSAEDIEAIIKLDSALAAATLRFANSAFFGGSPVDSISDAVMRLGLKEIYRLAALALVNRWEPTHGATLGWEPGDFCRYSLCTALGAEVLAERTEQIEPQMAYTAGLVHGIGKLALAHICTPYYPQVRATCAEKHCTWEEAERAVLGYHHAEVGARLLRAWRYPEPLALAAEFQINPAEGPADALALLAHLHAAKYLAISLGPGATEDGFLTTIHGDFLRESGFTPELLEEAMPLLLERAHARLGDKLTHGAVNV
jgi:HD-like signal output (HDOD) protein